jgi:hypothetical protein
VVDIMVLKELVHGLQHVQILIVSVLVGIIQADHFRIIMVQLQTQLFYIIGVNLSFREQEIHQLMQLVLNLN